MSDICDLCGQLDFDLCCCARCSSDFCGNCGYDGLCNDCRDELESAEDMDGYM